MSRNGNPYLLNTIPVPTGDGARLGTVIIYKRADHSEPRLWNCRVRVSAERRYLNRATGTVNEQEARSIALEHYWEAKMLAKHGDTVKLWTKAFDKVVDLWLKDVGELNEIGLKTDSQVHRYYYGIRGWKEYLNNKPINQISQDDVDSYERWRQENNTNKKPYSRSSINHDHMALSVCLKWAVRKKYLSAEDMPDVALGLKKKDQAKRPGFTDDEWKELQAFLLKWAHEPKKGTQLSRSRFQFRDYCLILANTGMRVGEARYLKWKHVSVEREDDDTYVYFKVSGKTGERELVTDSNCYLYLDSIKSQRTKWLGDDDYIFINSEGGYLHNQIEVFRNMLKKAGLLYADNGKPRTLTSLRHYYATRQLIRHNVDVFRLAENMGTSVTQIKNHYSDANPRLFRRHLTGRKPIIEVPKSKEKSEEKLTVINKG